MCVYIAYSDFFCYNKTGYDNYIKTKYKIYRKLTGNVLAFAEMLYCKWIELWRSAYSLRAEGAKREKR